MNSFIVKLKKVKGPMCGEERTQVIRSTSRQSLCEDLFENQTFYSIVQVDGKNFIGFCEVTGTAVFDDMDYELDPVSGEVYSVDAIEKRVEDDE